MALAQLLLERVGVYAESHCLRGVMWEALRVPVDEVKQAPRLLELASHDAYPQVYLQVHRLQPLSHGPRDPLQPRDLPHREEIEDFLAQTLAVL